MDAVSPYDHRDTVEALVDKDIRLHFDGEPLLCAPRYVGRRLTLKADSSSVTIYDRVHEIVSIRAAGVAVKLGADRFEAELAELRPAAKRSQTQHRLFAVLHNLCSQAIACCHHAVGGSSADFSAEGPLRMRPISNNVCPSAWRRLIRSKRTTCSTVWDAVTFCRTVQQTARFSAPALDEWRVTRTEHHEIANGKLR
jgi:hypothetical protein